MDSFLFFDIAIIFILVLFNGFFSGSEIAIISVRASQLKARVEKGDRRAKIISRLKSDPNNFFATVQIGVTIIGSLASAYGGVRLVPLLSPVFEGIPVEIIQEMAGEISLAILVIAISYLSLVLGELVPKSVALNYAERYALIVAYPLNFFSILFSTFTRLLTISSNLILKPFKDQTSFSETKLLEDEIRHLLEEGVKAGTFERIEHEIIENVLEVNETSAKEIMVPRVEISAVQVDASQDELAMLMDFHHSRMPVFNENLDHIVGVLHVKDLMRVAIKKGKFMLKELVRPAYFVPEAMKIGKILQEMQKRKIHIAIVVDEFGGTAGLLTMEDILEEIVGEIQDESESDESDRVIRTPDGSYLVSGSISISDFNEEFEKDLDESDGYTSLAGYIIEKLGRFPEVGEKIDDGKYEFELVKRIRQKMVQFRVVLKEETVLKEENSKE
ncbi:MAG: hemolysin family protein [Spirochaetia bacterium]|nr:hemolysin family protein [Spirochaetia bacterium]